MELISYPSVLSIFQYLSYSQRAKIAAISRTFRILHLKMKFSLEWIHLNIPYYWPENEQLAFLEVENIRYEFRQNVENLNLEVTCSLDPQRSWILQGFDAPKKFLKWFLETSAVQVPLVKLTETSSPFENIEKRALRIPRIEWNVNFGSEFPLLQHLPEDFQVGILQLVNFQFFQLECDEVKKCGHLILEQHNLYNEFVIGDELNVMRRYHGRLRGKLIQATYPLNHVSTFIEICKQMIENDLENGSWVKGVFRKSEILKEYVWHLASQEFPEGVDGFLKDGECFIIQITDQFIFAIFYTDSENDDDEKDSVTAKKLQRILEN